MKRHWVFVAGAWSMLACGLVTPYDESTADGALDAGSADSTPPEVIVDATPVDADAADASDAATAPPSKYRTAVMADLPVGYWRLGEKSGTVAKDEMNAHDGTYVGGVTLGTSPTALSDSDTAATFDGVSGRVVIGDVFGFSGGVPFSVESWVKISSPDLSIRYVVAKLSGDGINGWSLGLNRISEGMNFSVFQGGLYSYWSLPVAADTWVHQVGTFSPSNLCLYINGAQINCFDPGYMPAAVAEPLVFGGAVSDAGAAFNGAIDEVAIYDYPLTPVQVKLHFNARE